MTTAESKLLVAVFGVILLLTVGFLFVFCRDDRDRADERAVHTGRSTPLEDGARREGDDSAGNSGGDGLERLSSIRALVDRLVDVPDIGATREHEHALLIRKHMLRSDLNGDWERPVIGRLRNLGIRDFESELEVWLTYHDIDCPLNRVNKSSKAIKKEVQKGRKKTYWIGEILGFVYNPDRMILNRLEGYKKRKREISDGFLVYDALLAELESAIDECNSGKDVSPTEAAAVDPISQQELSAAINGAAMNYASIHESWPWSPLMEALILLKGRADRIWIRDGILPASSRARHLMKALEGHERETGELLRSIQSECRHIHPDRLEAMMDESLDRYAYLAETSCVEVFEKLLLACVLEGVLVPMADDRDKVEEIRRLSGETYEQFLLALRDTLKDLISMIAAKCDQAAPLMSSDQIEGMMKVLWPRYRTLLGTAVHATQGKEDCVQARDAFMETYRQIVETMVAVKKKRIRYRYLKSKLMNGLSLLMSEMVWEETDYFKTEEQIAEGPLRKKTVSDWEDELLSKITGRDGEDLLDRSERKGLVQAVRPRLQEYHLDLTEEAGAALRMEYANLVGALVEKKYRSGDERR